MGGTQAHPANTPSRLIRLGCSLFYTMDFLDPSESTTQATPTCIKMAPRNRACRPPGPTQRPLRMCLVHVKLSTHSTAPSPRRHSNATGPWPQRRRGGPHRLYHTWALPAAQGQVRLSALGTSGRGPPLTGKLEDERRVSSPPVVTARPRQHDGSPWSGTCEAWGGSTARGKLSELAVRAGQGSRV